jgi:hypothetical protein
MMLELNLLAVGRQAIINIPLLQERFQQAEGQGYLPQIFDEIVKQSKVEFNYSDEGEFEGDEDE